jgi:hypothetical protein
VDVGESYVQALPRIDSSFEQWVGTSSPAREQARHLPSRSDNAATPLSPREGSKGRKEGKDGAQQTLPYPTLHVFLETTVCPDRDVTPLRSRVGAVPKLSMADRGSRLRSKVGSDIALEHTRSREPHACARAPCGCPEARGTCL